MAVPDAIEAKFMLKRRLITVQADRAMYSMSSWNPC